jgi:hypothetical protein
LAEFVNRNNESTGEGNTKRDPFHTSPKGNARGHCKCPRPLYRTTSLRRAD